MLPKLLLGAALLAGGAFVFKTYQENQDSGKKEDPKAKKGGIGWGKKK